MCDSLLTMANTAWTWLVRLAAFLAVSLAQANSVKVVLSRPAHQRAAKVANQ